MTSRRLGRHAGWGRWSRMAAAADSSSSLHRCCGIGEVEIVHTVDRDDMDVHVGDFEPSDHEPDAHRLERRLLGNADGVRHVEQVVS